MDEEMKEFLEDFEDYKIEEVGVQFIDEGTAQPAEPFGCVGTMSGTTNTEEVIKKCEGRIVKKRKRKTDMLINISAHAKRNTLINIFGLSNKGLKQGVYGYGIDSMEKPFILAAKVKDMDDNVKYIAFANISNQSGFSFNIDNNATEIATMDLEFSALADKNKMFYYQAFEKELDEATKDQWLTKFSPELVKTA